MCLVLIVTVSVLPAASLGHEDAGYLQAATRRAARGHRAACAGGNGGPRGAQGGRASRRGLLARRPGRDPGVPRRAGRKPRMRWPRFRWWPRNSSRQRSSSCIRFRVCPPDRSRHGPGGRRARRYRAGFCQIETCCRLSLVKGSRAQSCHRSRSRRPASRAIRSSSDGHTYRNGIEVNSARPPPVSR